MRNRDYRRWYVWDPEGHGEDENGAALMALDAAEAAEEYARCHIDADDPGHVSENPITVRVSPGDGGKEAAKWLVVSAFPAMHYNASPTENPSATQDDS